MVDPQEFEGYVIAPLVGDAVRIGVWPHRDEFEAGYIPDVAADNIAEAEQKIADYEGEEWLERYIKPLEVLVRWFQANETKEN